MSDTITEWTTGTTWSLRKHAIRPGTKAPVGWRGKPLVERSAACNSNIYTLPDTGVADRELPPHVVKGRDTAPTCKRCEKIVAREAGRTLAEIAGVR